MRTTLNLDDKLLRAAKKLAAERNQTLTRILEDALRQLLHPPREPLVIFRLDLVTKKGRALPGVDFADRESVYARMDER